MTHSTLQHLCFLAVVLLCGTANGQTANGQTANSSPVRSVRLEVFVRSDLDSSQRAVKYANQLRQKNQHLDVQVHDVLKDRKQLARLYRLTKKSGRSKPVVPSFFSCRRMYFGFVDAATSGPRIESLFTADVYTRSSCPKCQKAKVFIAGLEKRWPAVRFRILEITEDTLARARWQALSSAGGNAPGLPTIDFAGRIFVGYNSDETTGRDIETWISEATAISDEPPRPKLGPPAGMINPTSLIFALQAELDDLAMPDDLALPGEAEEADIGTEALEDPVDSESAQDDGVTLPFFGRIRVSDLGMPLFTLAVGLVDGFNPCAMWILVFLLSVLVNIKDRRKIVLIAGTFVVVSGIAYFAFMAAWLNLFLLIGIVRPVQIVLGLLALTIGVINVKDFFAFKKGVTLSIPESQKPGLYKKVREIVDAKYITAAIAGAVALAIVVNMIELLCTAGLPALYTQILTLQELPAWKNYAYLGLYISAYMFDDTVLMTIVIATLSRRKLQEREGRWLKLISGLVILALGAVMIFRPEWLTLTS